MATKIKISMNPGTSGEIAATILTQIGTAVKMQIGARNFFARKKGLQFSITKQNGVNKIVIDLTRQDLYDMAFYYIPPADPTKFKKISEYRGVYNDQLDRLILDGLGWQIKNPKAKTGNFTLRTIAKNLSAEKFAHRFLALQRSGQYSELRGIQRGKKFNIVGYKWPSKTVRRKLNIGRARFNPSAASGPTPNQVYFGQRGKIKTGWINKETPTRYLITYKDGHQTRNVWRKKSSVTFVMKKGRKNPCKKYANPNGNSAVIKRAVKISKKFHRLPPRRITHHRIKMPRALIHLGECSQVNYVTDKWDEQTREYSHKFENKADLFASDRPQPDGRQMLMIIGKFKIESAGITG